MELYLKNSGRRIKVAGIKNSKLKWRKEWANDYDLDTCNTYRRNICPNDRESVVHGMSENWILIVLEKLMRLHLVFHVMTFQ